MNPGDPFGPYQIRRELGRGAMGIVYEAFDTGTQRSVALKLLQAGGDGARMSDELRERFRREGEVAGQLVHPNIVAVYDFRDGLALADGTRSGPFIVMEYVAGGDLKSRLAARARLALPQVAQVMGQLLAALRHAHERGIVHRDVKPANLLLRENGRLKLSDFGIARVTGSDLTQTGEVMGTVTYMSPEQLTGAPVDARADLYACGVILYELLTGEPPFVGGAATVMQKILNQEPLPPTRLNPALPPALDAVLDRALAKRPAERFADADAFGRALAQALAAGDEQSTLVRPVAGRSREGVSAPSPAADPPPTAKAVAARRPAMRVPVAIAALVAVAAALGWWRFAPAPARAVTAAALHSAEEVERMAWDHARAVNTPPAFEAYLEHYPDGAYAKLARMHLVAPHAPVRTATAPAASGQH